MKIIFTVLLLLITPLLHAKKFETQKWQTSQGTQVVFYPAMEVPMLDISLAFAAGSARDGKIFGLATLTNTLLNQGNAQLNADQIAEALEKTGAQYGSDTARDMAILNLRTLTEPQALSEAVSTFKKIISQPDFPQDAFDREKAQQLMLIKQTWESPDDVANQVFFANLYQQHPYAHPVNGTKDTVEKITLSQVKDFYKNYYVANNALIVMVGAISSEQAHQLAEQLTTDMPKGQKAPPIPQASLLQKPDTVNIDFPSSQTMIRVGQTGITHASPDYFPLLVGNYILGGNALVSILGQEVRVKQGLTYGIYSQFLPLQGTGPFIISLSTQNKESTRALDVSKQLLAAFIQNGPDEKQLLAARLYLTGNFNLSLASNRNIAAILLKMAFYQLPDDYLDTYTQRIEAVTVEMIKTAFQKQLNPEKMLTVTVGHS